MSGGLTAQTRVRGSEKHACHNFAEISEEERAVALRHAGLCSDLIPRERGSYSAPRALRIPSFSMRTCNVQRFNVAGSSVVRRICWHGDLRLRLQISEWYVEHSPCGQNHGALDEILQLANVPWPMIGDQNIHGFRGNRVDRPVHAPRELPGKVPDQQRNIVAAIPERRQQNRKNIQAIKQVGSELMVRNHFRKIAVCRRNQASVALQRARAPEPLELALLQNAQQLRLQFQRYFADLVQENRSTAREFKAPDALRDRAGESASLMAEDLAFEQSRWNRRAVQFDERILRTRT